jgi:DNA repair exonuclease SbcCD nuclease subunit
MKIALIADTHLGYSRFEKDAFIQAENAFLDASKKSDIILFAGDIFDIKVPKLETLNSAISIFNAVKLAGIPVIAIHGNHERRAKEMINPAKLLDNAGLIKHLHAESKIFEKDGDKIQVFGIGNFPEEFAEIGIKKAMERFSSEDGAFKILLLHQTIRELIPQGKNELALEYLETLPFDLIVNGHIHKKEIMLDGRFIIPGSTVITQLKKDETDPKGYFLFDTKEKKQEFVPIECRSFFYEEIEINEAGQTDVLEAVKTKIESIHKDNPEALIALKIKGTLKQGLKGSDIRIPNYDNVFIDNRLDEQSLNAKLEEIRNLRREKLSVRDLAIKELEEKTKDITAFETAELFNKLLIGTDEAIMYLEGLKNKEVEK